MESVELLKLINESLSDQGLVIHYEVNENGHGYHMFPVEWPMADKESGNVCHWSFVCRCRASLLPHQISIVI